MISNILGFWAPGPFELLIILFFLAVPAVLIILVVIYVTRGSKEREKLHQKMAELTDELKQTQEQLKEKKKGESSTKS
jgi:hypothetical protein